MAFTDLIVLLPCQSLESMSLQREAQEADEILAGWSALYHPALVASADGMPKWFSAENPLEAPSGSLVVVPPCTESLVPVDWIERAEDAGATLLRDYKSRDALVSAALALLPPETPRIDPCLAADFLALGFCHFEVELLTRQLRYMSNLDEMRFRQHVKEAAASALAGDETTAREHLRSGFDRLTEAREYFYPVETYLLDLTLVAPTTLGALLHDELASGRLLNLLISGSTLEEMARREPATLELLKQGIEQDTATLVGGEHEELELPLLATEDILAQLKRGLATYERFLGCRPTLFGRRRFGLTPLLPSLLHRLGFTGALHFTLDDGRFPTGNQSKIRWEGVDGADLEAMARLPFDIGQSNSFLRLPERLGNTMDLDHAATVGFAHWPGQSSPWYEDLRRMAKYGPVLGRFSLLATYFQNTLNAGRATHYEADKYRSPYLAQDVAEDRSNPISRWIGYHRRRAIADALQAVTTLNNLASGQSDGSAIPADQSLAPRSTEPENLQLDTQLEKRLAEAIAGFRISVGSASEKPANGVLLANPRSYPRRLCLDVSDLERLPDVAGPVLRASAQGSHKQVLVEVPPMGFAWVGPGTDSTATHGKKKSAEPLLADGNQIRNEFFEVTFSETTGAIRSIHNFAMRGNRLAQQIGMRLVSPSQVRKRGIEPGTEEEYSVMAADELKVVDRGPFVGCMVSKGRLLDRNGKRLAGFVQTTQARRGSRILEVEIELDIERMPEAEPWASYYAARFAWSDETADIHRGVGLVRRASDGHFLEAPYFLDIRAPRAQLTLLTGGLPYHRRFGLRKLDSLLVVHGETARRFRFGIGVDVEYSARAALDFLTSDLTHAQPSSSPPAPSGWLFHVDAKNVVATHWEPIVEDGRAAGFRVRLLETEGRYARVQLRSFRAITSALKTDFLGQAINGLSVDGDRITIELGQHELMEVEARFAQ